MSSTWHSSLVNIRHVASLPPEGSRVEYIWRCWKLDVNGEHESWNPFEHTDDVVSSAGLGLPRLGDKVSQTLTGLANTWADYHRWRNVAWSMVGDSMCVWEMTATATSRDIWCGYPNVSRMDSVSTRKVDLYRDKSPAAADFNGDTQVPDGDHTNDAGVPADNKTIAQVQVDITFLWNTADPQSTGYPNVGAWSQLINKRNSADFLGFAAGTVLFAGVSIDPEQDEYVRVNWTFLWDAWAHLTQEPARWLDGSVVLKPSGIGIGPQNVAKVVWWTQPYAATTDFGALFSSYELGWLNEGWGYYDDVAQECVAQKPAMSGPNFAPPKAAQLDVTGGIRDSPEPPP